MHGISKNAFIVLVNVADPFSLYTVWIRFQMQHFQRIWDLDPDSEAQNAPFYIKPEETL
jgi:hypothetical protein